MLACKYRASVSSWSASESAIRHQDLEQNPQVHERQTRAPTTPGEVFERGRMAKGDGGSISECAVVGLQRSPPCRGRPIRRHQHEQEKEKI